MTEEKPKTLDACLSCPSIKRRGEWFEVGETVYRKLQREVDLSPGYCSPKCMAQGAQISVEEARRILALPDECYPEDQK